MLLITLDKLSIEFGEQPILRDASLVIENYERVCLIGRNGAGKSTLLKIITGELHADSGEVIRKSNLRISQLTQALPNELNKTVHEFVVAGLVHLQHLVEEYHRYAAQELDDQGLRNLEDLQHQIEAEGGWHLDQRVDTVLSELDLPIDKKLSELSGGWQRRVGVARALVSNPELLLLDEPTNHLDLATIEWLEARIRNYAGSVMFITHDRAFMQRLATRIIELDRTKLTSWPGDYKNFLRRKEESLNAEDIDKALFEKKLAEEEAWIRQGIKARRTRNEGRVRALQAMRKEQEERQKFKRQPGARIHIESSEQESGRKVIDMHQVCFGYGEHQIINKFSLNIRRGDRIGLIGNNGIGKSTLLNLMLGKMEPQSGTVKLGTNLEIGYFDQMRRDLDPNKTIAEVVGDGRDYIKINGKDRHVIGYLRGFLFSAKRVMTPIKAISGGERNRVILAQLFTRPNNLLILDEPTNDLDVETLEVLEEKLVEYPGTLIVVSHDREFLDNVITSVLVFEDDDRIERYVGGYSDWLRHGKHLAEVDNPNANAKKDKNTIEEKPATTSRKKHSYKEKRELESLPANIESLELEQSEVEAQISNNKFYKQDKDTITSTLARVEQIRKDLEHAYHRWEELDKI